MADPNKATLKVTYSGIDPVTGKAKFTVDPDPPGSLPVGPDGPIFNNDHHPGFHIVFVLTDDTHQNYAFPPNSKKDMAVSSQMGSKKCPPQKTSPNKGDVFQALSVGQTNTDNDTLTVLNANVDPFVGVFSYVLWMTNDGGKTFVPLDPGGVNQNGPTQRFLLANVIATVVAIVVIALVVLYFVGAFSH